MLLQAKLENGIWTGEPFDQPMVLTARFGEPRDNGLGYHSGVDLAPLDGQPGCPIRFMSQAFFIEWCGVYGGTRARDVNGGYGNVLRGRTQDGYTVLLAHQQRFAVDVQMWINSGFDPNLKPTFSPGEVIGYQGNTGYVYANGVIPPDDDMVSATHTHFEVRNSLGQFVDPLVLLTGYVSPYQPGTIPLP